MRRKIIAVASIVLSAASGAWAATPVRISPRLDDLPAGTRLSRHAGTGLVRFLAAPAGRVFANQPVATLGVGAQARARSFLSVYGGTFGLSDQVKDLTYKSENNFAGRTSVRFQQLYGGLPVIGGELVVNLDHDGNVISANGETVPASGLITVPIVTTAEATQTAIQAIADARQVPSDSLVATVPARAGRC